MRAPSPNSSPMLSTRCEDQQGVGTSKSEGSGDVSPQNRLLLRALLEQFLHQIVVRSRESKPRISAGRDIGVKSVRTRESPATTRPDFTGLGPEEKKESLFWTLQLRVGAQTTSKIKKRLLSYLVCAPSSFFSFPLPFPLPCPLPNPSFFFVFFFFATSVHPELPPLLFCTGSCTTGREAFSFQPPNVFLPFTL